MKIFKLKWEYSVVVHVVSDDEKKVEALAKKAVREHVDREFEDFCFSECDDEEVDDELAFVVSVQKVKI